MVWGGGGVPWTPTHPPPIYPKPTPAIGTDATHTSALKCQCECGWVVVWRGAFRTGKGRREGGGGVET